VFNFLVLYVLKHISKNELIKSQFKWTYVVSIRTTAFTQAIATFVSYNDSDFTMDLENNNNNTQMTGKEPEKCAGKRKHVITAEDKGGEIKRLKTEDPTVEATSRPPPQSPKKRLQLNGKPKHNKDHNFTYGNYKHYYGKRILDKNFRDIRLDVLGTQPDLFRGKQLLDIGCNSGHLSIQIAKTFEAKSLVGLDIDRGLVKDAQNTISHLKRQAGPGQGFPHNIRFVQGNYVLEDDVLLEAGPRTINPRPGSAGLVSRAALVWLFKLLGASPRI